MCPAGWQSITRRSLAGTGENIRHFTVRPYVIFYRPQDDGIELVRVLHSARDIAAVFRDE